MTSLILYTATRYMLPLMLLFSIFVMLRGHHEPGGGFVGGLIAAATFALYAFSYNVKQARQALRLEPRVFIGLGLLTALSSGLLSLVGGVPFMTGLWLKQPLPILGKFGTPVLFDIGVYLAVLGVTLLIIFSMAEQE